MPVLGLAGGVRRALARCAEAEHTQGWGCLPSEGAWACRQFCYRYRRQPMRVPFLASLADVSRFPQRSRLAAASRRRVIALLGAVCLMAGVAAIASPVSAQAASA